MRGVRNKRIVFFSSGWHETNTVPFSHNDSWPSRLLLRAPGVLLVVPRRQAEPLVEHRRDRPIETEIDNKAGLAVQ